MSLKQYLLCFITVGFFFGCNESLDTNEHTQPSVDSTDELSYEISDLPIYDIQSQDDYNQVLSISESLKKPVLVHISGYACVSSRYFEDGEWLDPLVYPLLKNQFLIAKVYVDDHTTLPNATNLPDSLDTYGEYWMNYEIERYSMVTQPINDIVNSKNESLVNGIATYHSHNETNLYKLWLDQGLANFKKQNYE